MKLELSTPDYTTLCRRRSSLNVHLAAGKLSSTERLHVVVDSTGLTVYGEGEWKARQRGYSKRRTWRKLHLAIDEATGDVLTEALTENNIHGSEVLLPILEQIHDPIGQVSADGHLEIRHVIPLQDPSSGHSRHELVPTTTPLRSDGVNCATLPRRSDEHFGNGDLQASMRIAYHQLNTKESTCQKLAEESRPTVAAFRIDNLQPDQVARAWSVIPYRQ